MNIGRTSCLRVSSATVPAIAVAFLISMAAPGFTTAMADPRPIGQAAETNPGKSFFLHLASFRREDNAYEELRRLRQKYDRILAELNLEIRRVALAERGVYYRVLVGPFLSRFVASAYCSEIQSAGQNCVVLPQ